MDPGAMDPVNSMDLLPSPAGSRMSGRVSPNSKTPTRPESSTALQSNVKGASKIMRHRMNYCQCIGSWRQEKLRHYEEEVRKIPLEEIWASGMSSEISISKFTKSKSGNIPEAAVKHSMHSNVRGMIVRSVHSNGDALSYAKPIDGAEFVELLVRSSPQVLGQTLTIDEANQLICFADSDRDGKMTVSELRSAALLWKVVTHHEHAWQQRLRGSRSLGDVLAFMKHLNEGSVSMREAEWVLQMSDMFCTGTGMEELAFNLAVAFWFNSPRAEATSGLVRTRLMERLLLEYQFQWGLVRLCNLIAMFFLLTAALTLSGSSDSCRTIQETLANQYNLESLEDVTTMDDVRDFMASFQGSSAVLAPLSQEYFGDNSQWMLLGAEETFDEPQLLPEIDIWIGSSFTIQAWVRIERGTTVTSSGIPLLRKPLGAEGDSLRMSCWSWNFPPSLSFGAHDYGRSYPDGTTGLLQEHVSIQYPASSEAKNSGAQFDEYDRMVLHTAVVNSTHAVFMRDNGTMLGVVALPRPVTDCEGSFMTLGSSGVSLAAVQYFPKAISRLAIEEIYKGGSMMADIGYSIPLQKIEPLSRLERMSRQVTDLKRTNKLATGHATQLTWAASTLTAEAILEPLVAKDPYVNATHTTWQGVDPSIGQPLWQIYDTAVYTDHTSINGMPGDALPRLSERGFTVSAWLKFNREDSGFLMAKGVPQGIGEDGQTLWPGGYLSLCWYIYVGGGSTEVQVRSGQGSPVEWGAGFGLNDQGGEELWQVHGKAFRHFVFRIDPQNHTHPGMICIDGDCRGTDGWQSPSVPNFPLADCEDCPFFAEDGRNFLVNDSEIFLNRRPPNDWHFRGQQMNLKYFDRALTDDQVRDLFYKESDPEHPDDVGSMRVNHGCKFPDEQLDDMHFRDEFGHDCYWYFMSRRSDLGLCDRALSARAACPMACQSVETCWGILGREERSMQIFDRQIEFRSRGVWGTTCVGKSTTAAREAIKCGLGAPGFTARCNALGLSKCESTDCSEFEHDETALIECLSGKMWVSQPGGEDDGDATNTGCDQVANDPLCAGRMLPCADIVRFNDPHCAWDDEELDSLAMEINSTEEWSIQFWVESTTTGCLQPQIRLLDGDGFTFSWVGGYYHHQPDPRDEASAEGCNTDGWLSHGMLGTRESGFSQLATADVAMDPPRPGDKHLVVFGRRADGFVGIQFDGRSNFDNPEALPPMKTDRNFLRVINVIGNIRMSPWKLSPYFPQQREISATQYEQLASEQLKRGPSKPLNEQLTEQMSRETGTFISIALLAAPPLLIQDRESASECSSTVSNVVKREIHRVGQNRFCTDPYECSFTPSQVYECPGGKDDSMFFGLNRVREQGYFHDKYVDFLATIAGHSIVVRPEDEASTPRLMHTHDFLDTLTSEVQIAALFYSIEFGIISSLSITFEADSGMVQGGYSLQHYVSLEGESLLEYQKLQITNYVFLGILFLDNVRGMHEQWIHYKKFRKWDVRLLVLIFIDLCVQVSAQALVQLALQEKAGSQEQTMELIGLLFQLPWDDEDVNYDYKKGEYLSMFTRLDEMVQYSKFIEDFAMVMALVLLCRTILATRAHPRIAMVTKTLWYASSDMAHFAVIFFLVFCGFAVLATWRFASSREDLKDFQAAFFVQIDAMLGPPGAFEVSASETDRWDYMTYVIIFHVICFFFVLNFILAIIVEAYDKGMKDVDGCAVEQDIVSDFISVWKNIVFSWAYSWPQRRVMVHALDCIENRFVNPAELTDTGLFETEDHAQAYFAFYTGMPMLSEEDKDEADALDEISESVSAASNKIIQLKCQVDESSQLIRDLSARWSGAAGGGGGGGDPLLPLEPWASPQATPAAAASAAVSRAGEREQLNEGGPSSGRSVTPSLLVESTSEVPVQRHPSSLDMQASPRPGLTPLTPPVSTHEAEHNASHSEALCGIPGDPGSAALAQDLASMEAARRLAREEQVQAMAMRKSLRDDEDRFRRQSEETWRAINEERSQLESRWKQLREEQVLVDVRWTQVQEERARVEERWQAVLRRAAAPTDSSPTGAAYESPAQPPRRARPATPTQAAGKLVVGGDLRALGASGDLQPPNQGQQTPKASSNLPGSISDLG